MSNGLLLKVKLFTYIYTSWFHTIWIKNFCSFWFVVDQHVNMPPFNCFINIVFFHILNHMFPISLAPLSPSRSTPCWPPRRGSSIRCRITAMKTPRTNSSSRWTEESLQSQGHALPLPPVFNWGFHGDPLSPVLYVCIWPMLKPYLARK